MRQRDHKCEITNERATAGGRIGSYQRAVEKGAQKQQNGPG
jgi:hypothetical protein